MRIKQLYTYPIKSLRPHELEEAQLTSHGFRYDRRFMLLQVVKDDAGRPTYKNMHLSHYSEMVLFFPELHPPSGPDVRDGKIVVTFQPPSGTSSSIDIPLQPEVEALSIISVEMHKSPTQAYEMPASYNAWFSARFGFEVILAYLGEHHRPVLMSSPHSIEPRGLLASMSNAAASFLGGQTGTEPQITFADCAPYLVVSERSMDDVHPRLPEGQMMDISKFRPNIIVSGAGEPWEEDYWGEITINGSTKIECVHNCARCQSINIDYATGKPQTNETGKMLAKLQKDRRIDPGAKYSPVFGRYSFLNKRNEGDFIKVGDEVSISRVNSKRTKFDWTGLCT